MKINRPVPQCSHVAGDVVEWSSVTEDVPMPPKHQFALELDHNDGLHFADARRRKRSAKKGCASLC